MKKYFNFAFLSAIALAGAFGITACSSSDDLAAETNPNYNPNTKEVTVDFVFNVETGANASTRMSASTVQIGTNTFRGIKNAQLFTYKLGTDGKHVSANTETADKTYDLDQLLAQGQLNGTGTDQSRRVLEMALPTGTNTLMFWGRAMQSTVPEGKTAGAVYGSISFAPSATLANAAFTLSPCVPDDASSTGRTALTQYEKLIAKVLNDIVQASSTVNVTLGDKTVNKTMAWKDYVNVASDGKITMKEKDPSTDGSVNMCALGEILANTFISLNSFRSGELRNGQGKMIALLMGDLKTVMSSITGASATTVEERAAQAVASNIVTIINKYFTTDNKWDDVNTVKNNSGLTTATPPTDLSKVTGDLNKFPDGLFHLPPGATVMVYDAANNSWSYMSEVPTYAMGSANGSFNPNNYMYPAELCYFGNSPIRVSDDAHVKNDYPDGASNWDNDPWTGWQSNSKVKSTTRSVAMQENINYGTAVLKSTIAYKTGVTNLKDNNSGIHDGENDNLIAVSPSPFTLTGVLVGGQPQTVGWNYIVKTIDPDPFICMVYDNELPSTTIPTPTGSENYTMVWDNYTTAATQNTVYVALELTNNSGSDFWGRNNLIRNGASFYLIGKLDPANPKEGSSITWPTKYALPPYDANGATIQTPRVFIQDYMTTANFIIDEGSLKQALVSMPDLRATHMSLGLSVDLSWSNGLNFESILGQ